MDNSALSVTGGNTGQGMTTQNGGLLGAIGRGWNDLSGTSANNAFSAAEAQKQRDWEEYMSNTSYQRQVADMQAAGINPMAAAGAGGGASTPNGASAAAHPSSGSGLGRTLIGTIGSLISNVVGKKIVNTGMAKKTASQAAAAMEREVVKCENALTLAEMRHASAVARQNSEHEWKEFAIPYFNREKERSSRNLEYHKFEHKLDFWDYIHGKYKRKK